MVAIYYDGYPLSPIGVTLQHCALVCRAWRPRAQFWLFEYVAVHDVDTLQRLAKVFHDSPHLAAQVSHMWLLCRYQSGTLRNGLCRLPTVLPYAFPSLRTLLLRGSHLVREPTLLPKLPPFIPIPPRFHILLAPQTVNVTVLQICDIRFHSFAEFANLLSCFPSVKHMECYNILWAKSLCFPKCMSVKVETGRRKPFLGALRELEVHL